MDKTLEITCHQGHVAVVRHLFNACNNIQFIDADGDTPLHYAVFGNKPEVVKLLLDRSACVNQSDNSQSTPLHVALRK